ncbi:MAG: Fic family protein [Lentisphaeraceae bacterium]|nr:Fic family protein [Lentisphaeraceae bacterium]
MFADKGITFEDLKEKLPTNMSEEEYVNQSADNALSVEIFLSHKNPILKVDDCKILHATMNCGVDKNAGIINGKRRLGFFDNNGLRNMVDGPRLALELKLLDSQTKELMNQAKNNKEDKIKALCIQAMRLFSIHPFNDANKRIVKTLIRHFMEKEFKIHIKPEWNDISQKVLNQAVRGNNIGPLARKICEIYKIDYNPKKIGEIEISPFKIYPDTGNKVYSLRKEFQRSMTRKGMLITYKEPIINRQELKALGIHSSFFKKNNVCEGLLDCTNIDSLLRKIKRYHLQGCITDHQAQSLVKKLIIMTDGSEERKCNLATKKFLTTEINDIKKALNFYEREAAKQDFPLSGQVISLKKDSELDRTQTINSGIKLR